MESIWSATAEKPSLAVGKETKTDVLIIGGGMAGVLCAHFLQEAKVPYLLVEEREIGSGVTKNTTAKITSQHALIYRDLLRKFDRNRAKMYLDASCLALERYRRLCRDLDADFVEADSFVYSLDDREKLREELEVYAALGYPASFVEKTELPFAIAGAVKVEKQGMFHPLKFLYAIAQGLNIWERCKVLELLPGGARTSKGVIRAEKIIVATHFPFLNKHGLYFLKLYQSRSYVLALEGAPHFEGMYVDERDKGLSFRSYQNLLLLGGGSHRTGKQGGNWAELEEFARRYFSGARVLARWATQDCMTLDGVPYIGRYSSRTPDLFVATGFHKWGMTSSMVAAEVLTDLVQGKKNPNAPVFSPSRSMLRPQLAVNAAESLLSLLTPTAPRCPHLGCALHYNPQERSWDCSCHGSRFDRHGALLNGPATGDLKKRKH